VVGVLESAVDLTYLADTVVLLRYFESSGSVRQAVSVIKKRSGDHERSIREIWVGRKGISVGPPLTEVHGILGGNPTFSVPQSQPFAPSEP
jgi:circadian clock protein KaiC